MIPRTKLSLLFLRASDDWKELTACTACFTERESLALGKAGEKMLLLALSKMFNNFT